MTTSINCASLRFKYRTLGVTEELKLNIRRTFSEFQTNTKHVSTYFVVLIKFSIVRLQLNLKFMQWMLNSDVQRCNFFFTSCTTFTFFYSLCCEVVCAQGLGHWHELG